MRELRHSRNRLCSRRRVLQAFGASAAALPFVPLLESAAGGAESPPLRFLVMFHPHGVYRPNWVPQGGETDFVLPSILDPLEPFRDRLLVVDGLRMAVPNPCGQHLAGPAYVVTGSPMLDTDEFHDDGCEPCPRHGWASSISIDQAIANVVGNDTPFRSLEFGVQTGPADPGARIAYAGPAQPLAPEPDPAAMFMRIFGDVGLDGTAAAKLKAERLGVIDAIKPDLDALIPKVGSNDRVKIEAHLAAIEDMQQQLDASYTCEPVEPAGGGDPFDYGNLEPTSHAQLDLIAQAFACGVTNVGSLMYRLCQLDDGPYGFAGVDSHHNMTHAGDSDTDTWDKLTTVYRWYGQQLAYLAGKLDAIIEPDGSTVLDNTVILWATEVAQGNTHSYDDMPFVLMGGGGGLLNTGRSVRYAGVNHCRLHVTLCNLFGVDVDTFGTFDEGGGAITDLLL